MYAKLTLAFSLALLPAAALASQPSGSGPASATGDSAQTTTERAPAPQRRERLMCRRIGLTGQPTSIRRVCKTAAEWREIDDSE